VNSQFGEKIKQLREANNLLQRQVASELQIDTPMLSKIERGERKAKKEQVLLFAKIYHTSKEELLTIWLADQIFNLIQGEAMGDEAIKWVSKKIRKK
jgi:transcriptional regulator with XRE-family HTH domain